MELLFINQINNNQLKCLLTKAYIEDLMWHAQDFCDPCDFEDTQQVKEADYELNYQQLLTEDESLMLSLGLPLSFGKSNTITNSRKTNVNVTIENNQELSDSLYELNIEPQEEEPQYNYADWYEFWQTNGDDLIMKSWCEKYKDYLNPDYIHDDNLDHSENECSNEVISNTDTTQGGGFSTEWSDLWNEHIAQVYADAYQSFANSIVQCTNENNDKTCKKSLQSSNSTDQAVGATLDSPARNRSSTLSANGSDDDDDPPDESMIKRKRPHEEEVDDPGNKPSQNSEDQAIDAKTDSVAENPIAVLSTDDTDDDNEHPNKLMNKRKRPHGEEVAQPGVAGAIQSTLKTMRLESQIDHSLQTGINDCILKIKVKNEKLFQRYKKFRKELVNDSDVKKVAIEENKTEHQGEDESADATLPSTDSLVTDVGELQKKKRGKPSFFKTNPNLKKFWKRRYSLFSKYEEGIQLDAESWYSVTPEKLATHQAKRSKCDIIVDTCCGVGGNAIQFARFCNKVIAIDICEKKLDMAQHNAEIYGVADRIEFINGDCMKILSTLRKADVVFIDPPWGGVGVSQSEAYSITQTQPNTSHIFELAKKLTDDIVVFMPRNTNTSQLVALAGPGGKCEIEKNFVNNRFLTITAYYGNLVENIALD